MYVESRATAEASHVLLLSALDVFRGHCWRPRRGNDTRWRRSRALRAASCLDESKSKQKGQRFSGLCLPAICFLDILGMVCLRTVAGMRAERHRVAEEWRTTDPGRNCYASSPMGQGPAYS